MIDVNVNRKIRMTYILSGFMNISSIRNIIIMSNIMRYIKLIRNMNNIKEIIVWIWLWYIIK
jgi:hypothetical protein